MTSRTDENDQHEEEDLSYNYSKELDLGLYLFVLNNH
jgi:hypothetical protein